MRKSLCGMVLLSALDREAEALDELDRDSKEDWRDAISMLTEWIANSFEVEAGDTQVKGIEWIEDK